MRDTLSNMVFCFQMRRQHRIYDKQVIHSFHIFTYAKSVQFFY